MTRPTKSALKALEQQFLRAAPKTTQPPAISKKAPMTGTGIFDNTPPRPKLGPSPALPITGPQKSGK